MSGKTVKRCPKCKSTEVYFHMGASLGMLYKCKKCGYIGPLVIEEDVE